MSPPLLLTLLFAFLISPTISTTVCGGSLIAPASPPISTAASPLISCFAAPPSFTGSAASPSSLSGGVEALSPLFGGPATAAIPRQLEHLAPILANLGFQHLADAVHSIAVDNDLSASGGPITVFAPSDSSFLSCAPPACSPIRLLGEHIVPGRFTRADISNLPFGARLGTSVTDRCLRVTTAVKFAASSPSTVGFPASAPESEIYVDGVRITRPDLYDDGMITVHGIDGFIAPLTAISCIADPYDPAFLPTGMDSSLLMRLMLRDAMIRLHFNDYSILSLAMRVKYPDLVELHNMTIFALDDPVIYGGAESYVDSVRFHIVPNRLLVHADLVRLPVGTVLPTLADGQHLVVTSSGVGWRKSSLKINYVPIKAPDVIYNTKIAVHGIYMPFPHLNLADQEATSVPSEEGLFNGMGACSDGLDGCDASPSAIPAPSLSEALFGSNGL